MVLYQCTEPRECKEIDKLFERLIECSKPECESGHGPDVIRVLVAGLRLAHFAALRMGMSDEAAFHCVADSLRTRLSSTNQKGGS